MAAVGVGGRADVAAAVGAGEAALDAAAAGGSVPHHAVVGGRVLV